PAALCGEAGETAIAELAKIVHRTRMPEGRIIYGGHQRSKTFAIIISGVVKLVNGRPDGRQQIVGLQFAADFVGRPFTESLQLYAEAATDLELCTFSGRAFEELLRQYPNLERAMFKAVVKDLDAAREWMFMLGRKSAEEKVASFLAFLSDRMSSPDAAATKAGGKKGLRLPLSRTEIAECLGLRLETVSRQFAVLREQGIVETSGRRFFCVRDMGGLRDCSESSVGSA
ncbi:MAG: Crp/Fnr family transcriptional regulator, partial [Hyphomicrobium sp.]|nr:Crp/Fnr family transcriptional regulator [Hyphomicrobium sp.]